MDVSNLSLNEKADLARELAGHIVSWRRTIPRSRSSGNLHFQPHVGEAKGAHSYSSEDTRGPSVYVYGSVGSGNDHGRPVRSHLEYWRQELGWQITQLSTRSVFAPNREILLPPLRRFMHETLPVLSMFRECLAPAFVFTHTDLFPRNVLIHGRPPKISGIVDFEFSGFFPPMDEFSQEWLPEDDGSQWPDDMYQIMIEELERQDEVTPRVLTTRQATETKSLHVLRNYIAPWWLATAESETGDETAIELTQASQRVHDAIEVLGLS